MLEKNWKKILLFILIVACILNITIKLVNIISFDKAIENVKIQIQSIQKKD